ncbi:hypothetical protein DXG01_002793 [Tephrocybe rancida]|nr:hypothetical protein DXG01_002793 [Tephrocybe rancida]
MQGASSSYYQSPQGYFPPNTTYPAAQAYAPQRPPLQHSVQTAYYGQNPGAQPLVSPPAQYPNSAAYPPAIYPLTAYGGQQQQQVPPKPVFYQRIFSGNRSGSKAGKRRTTSTEMVQALHASFPETRLDQRWPLISFIAPGPQQTTVSGSSSYAMSSSVCDFLIRLVGRMSAASALICLISHRIISVLFLPTVYAVVTLEVGSTAGVLVPTTVTWTREDGDPTIFDLRFVSGHVDVGFAATIEAPNGELSGTIPVTFMTQGPFVLKAVDFEHGDQVIAASSHIDVGANPPSPSLPPSSQTVIALPTTSSTVTATTSGTSGPTGTPSASTSTASSTSTLTHAGSTKAPTSASSKPSINTAAIVGGVLGGVILILILAILFVLNRRRREEARAQRRLTFHRDLMVQHRPVAPDIEHGRGIGTSPILPPLGFQPQLTLATPKGPTRSQFRRSAILLHTDIADHPPTHRQVQLGGRIVQLEQQMTAIRRQNRGGDGGMGPVLEQMKRQVEWLRAERDSPWARCETDVVPPLLDYYME